MPRNPSRYDHLIAFALEHPWAITPAMGSLIAGILARRLAGDDPDEAAIAAARAARATQSVPVTSEGGLVAVIPLHGVIAPRMNLFSDVSGGATFEGLTEQLHAAMADPAVKTIVFDVDSPGGNVAGATEFSREVLKARTQKTIIASGNHLLASAAYWAMAGATEIVASPSSLVGSIGVLTLHDDITAALDKLGIKREVISAGKYKGEGAGGGPLTPEARAHVQDLIDGAYGRFVGDVAVGRGVKPAAVRAGFGEGRALGAEAALEAGLIDRIAPLEETLARVTKAPTGAGTRVAVVAPSVTTGQEPPIAATSQESRAVRDPSFVEYEQRVLALALKGLQ
jgi:signal peptide peptidase SppA